MIALRTISITLLLLACSFLSNAQSNEDVLEFGIRGGINQSNLKDSNGKSRFGPTIGFFAEYNASEKVAIRSELKYSSLGTKEKENISGLKLNYVQALPILLKVYPAESFSLEIGPYAGYLLNKKGSINKSDLRKFDFGASAGLGYHLTDHLELGARYYFGMRDITKTIGKAKNRFIEIALSYTF
ncbi:PorT family protein [Flagellimonas sp. HMM57]|uniref:porin family protein n=1 Tax=unclassified Flagellimonas TaxID=2644544 RepID=UPI0013D5D29F|nr:MULTISPECIES: porin family protein [unclassified Flagellimonas]UII74778.1 PorT family protein [Flagellimonas sp. HMM57]